MPLAGDGVTGRFDMGGMLGWPSPECDFFREVMTAPKIVPVLNELLGTGHGRANSSTNNLHI